MLNLGSRMFHTGSAKHTFFILSYPYAYAKRMVWTMVCSLREWKRMRERLRECEFACKRECAWKGSKLPAAFYMLWNVTLLPKNAGLRTWWCEVLLGAVSEWIQSVMMGWKRIVILGLNGCKICSRNGLSLGLELLLIMGWTEGWNCHKVTQAEN